MDSKYIVTARKDPEGYTTFELSKTAPMEAAMHMIRAPHSSLFDALYGPAGFIDVLYRDLQSLDQIPDPDQDKCFGGVCEIAPEFKGKLLAFLKKQSEGD